MPARVEYIVLHCTDSPWGTLESVRRFHVEELGWADVGYHYLVTNPYAKEGRVGRPDIELDGKLWPGRDLDRDGNVDEELGAHVRGWNHRSLGVALVGQRIRNEDGKVLGTTFTGAQLRQAVWLCRELCHRHEVPFSNVLGHYEVPGATKTCPDIDMEYFRELMRGAA